MLILQLLIVYKPWDTYVVGNALNDVCANIIYHTRQI